MGDGDDDLIVAEGGYIDTDAVLGAGHDAVIAYQYSTLAGIDAGDGNDRIYIGFQTLVG